MSPFPIHPPLTSDQVSEKSLERLPGKTADRQTHPQTSFSDSSSTAASLKAQVSTLAPYKTSQLQPTRRHTFFTSSWLQKQKQRTLIRQIHQLDFLKTAISMPFQPLQPSPFEENGKKASPFSLLAMHKPLVTSTVDSISS